MRLKAISNKLIIRPDEAETRTKSGIIIPESAKEIPLRGRVISAGPGKDGDMMTVQEDDVVLYGKYSGQEIEYEGVKYIVILESDVLAVID